LAKIRIDPQNDEFAHCLLLLCCCLRTWRDRSFREFGTKKTVMTATGAPGQDVIGYLILKYFFFLK
jgi:hypothetical protein